MAKHGFCPECGEFKQVRPVEEGDNPVELCFRCRVVTCRCALDPPVETAEFLCRVAKRPKVQQQLREVLEKTNIG